VDKYSTYSGKSSSGHPYIHLVEPGTRHGLSETSGLEKTASGEHLPGVLELIESLTPQPDRLYLVNSALGAGEYVGFNLRGDWFTEAGLNHAPPGWDDIPVWDIDARRRAANTTEYVPRWGRLAWGYPTFYNAHRFRHHVNKDPERAYGYILGAFWDPRMRRIVLVSELLEGLCRKLGASHIYDRIKRNEFPDSSMGSKVPYDRCSICGNIARTPAQYCKHVQKPGVPPYGMRAILPDGRMCGVYNDYPRFFDDSFVFIGAERSAKVMSNLTDRVQGSREYTQRVYPFVPPMRKVASAPADLLPKQGTGPSHIFITGLPGSGKTTLGKKKAKELGLPLISLDGVAAKNKRWAGTADARRFIRRLDTPHVIEGTQLLGFRKEDLKGHQVHVLEEPKSVLVDRLVRRGWNDSSGKLHKGEGARARTEAFHDNLSSALIDFKKTAAQRVRDYTRKDGTRVKGSSPTPSAVSAPDMPSPPDYMLEERLARAQESIPLATPRERAALRYYVELRLAKEAIKKGTMGLGEFDMWNLLTRTMLRNEHGAIPEDMVYVKDMLDTKLKSLYGEKYASISKWGEMMKRIPAPAPHQLSIVREHSDRMPDIPTGILDAISESPGPMMRASARHGVILRPHEFQRVLLRKLNPPLADRFHRDGLVFPSRPLSMVGGPSYKPGLPLGNSLLDKVMSILGPILSGRSFAPRAVRIRITSVSPVSSMPRASRTEFQHPVLDKVADLYDEYRGGLLAHPPDWRYSPSGGRTSFVDLSQEEKVAEDSQELSNLLLGLAYWPAIQLGLDGSDEGQDAAL